MHISAIFIHKLTDVAEACVQKYPCSGICDYLNVVFFAKGVEKSRPNCYYYSIQRSGSGKYGALAN